MALVARCSLWGLPAEIRLHIDQLLLASVEIHVQRGPERLPSHVRYDTSSDGDDDDDRDEEYDAEQVEEQDRPGCFVDTERRGAEVSWRDRSAPSDRNVADIRRGRRRLHSAATYHFASTLAFVDVLSQWSDEKLRHVSVVDTPLPLSAFAIPDFYVTHNFNEALSLFLGLQLDSLTVENVWLSPGGNPLDAWRVRTDSALVLRDEHQTEPHLLCAPRV